jgi:thioredoxin 1
MTILTSKKSFTREILNGTGSQVVRFCAEWSGPCQIMNPIYEQMEILFAYEAKFYKIDIEKVPALQKEFGIIELPTIIIYKNGSAIEFIVGLISRESLVGKLHKSLK